MYRERRCCCPPESCLNGLLRLVLESDHAQAVSDLLAGELDPVEPGV